jgi:citrate lyase subunit beta / citryl-CoA lyase
MIEKAKSLTPDSLFLDLEDAVAPAMKQAARANVIAAICEGGFTTSTVSVRINDATTPWAYRDVVDLVEQAGAQLDCIMLPKAESADHVRWLDLTLHQMESALGLPPGGIGIEVQIESARGLLNVDAIASASPRIETLILGPADLIANLRMRTAVVGGQPHGYGADAYHHVFMLLLIAARANGVQVIDGPHLQIKDVEGLRAQAHRTAALGFDGKWAVHPSQIDVIQEVFSPTQQEYDHSEAVLDAYAQANSAEGGHVGAVMFDEEMLDEASRKMALVVAARGRAAGLMRAGEAAP